MKIACSKITSIESEGSPLLAISDTIFNIEVLDVLNKKQILQELIQEGMLFVYFKDNPEELAELLQYYGE